ncbi:hypothetical protein [Rhodohalobacter sp.]|uniref:hypothetical protein n=1 Tax=Rhodohalobacter sp. TaxID=1974210 RepID=UPI002ACECF4F|nr:hypothetical protein [Rhodohalobacter sp.]MDZ7757459.1 hypothetical protein [Rhodohalobacter sp.]
MTGNTDHKKPDRITRVHLWVGRILLIVVGLEWIYLLTESQWLSLFVVSLLLIVLFIPIIFRKRLQVDIPAEFHLTAVIFTFAALYLGEVQHFYQRVWWWDIGLHASAGLIMGIFGFLLIYILNESKRIDIHLTSGFIALFAFTFAVSIGTIWEILEFTIDHTFELNMQKQMMDDPSGLTDTMWDMIVNAGGAFIISMSGWMYLKSAKNYFVREWIKKFIEKNPRLFSR